MPSFYKYEDRKIVRTSYQIVFKTGDRLDLLRHVLDQVGPPSTVITRIECHPWGSAKELQITLWFDVDVAEAG